MAEHSKTGTKTKEMKKYRVVYTNGDDGIARTEWYEAESIVVVQRHVIDIDEMLGYDPDCIFEHEVGVKFSETVGKVKCDNPPTFGEKFELMTAAKVFLELLTDREVRELFEELYRPNDRNDGYFDGDWAFIEIDEYEEPVWQTL